MTVHFYEKVEDDLLKFAVIFAKYNGNYVFCKHRERDTLEMPGGHREKGEEIDAAARRELQEETGAIDFDITPVCVYSVVEGEDAERIETFGMLYAADIRTFETELHNEIEQVVILNQCPQSWTYPQIQPLLFMEVERRGTHGL